MNDPSSTTVQHVAVPSQQSSPTTIQNIRLFLISPSHLNPRKTIDMESLKELAANIEKQGLLQPITVRPVDKAVINRDGNTTDVEYEIVCGERRYRACSLLALETIPCIVRSMTDDEALDAMITENLQRRDVDPVEEAEAFRILTNRGQTVDELALRFGKSQSYIRDRMRLTSLVPQLRQALSSDHISLGGAYLLARLSADDQQQFLDDEYDGDSFTSTDDVKYWIDDYFMNLFRAPFHDGKTISETWNPQGKLIRRCQTCECNTNNVGCLFADMKTDDPQCTDRVCFDRKTDIYYDWFIRQYAARLTRQGQSVAPGDVVLVEGYEIYSKDEKKRLEDLKEKLTLQGYRVFNQKQLGMRCWHRDVNLKEGLRTGRVVEAIDISDMASRRRVEISYRYLPSKVATSSLSDSQSLVSRLVERVTSIETSTQKKVTACARQAFDKDAYIARTSEIVPWELDIMAAIVFDMVPWTEQDVLIQGTGTTHATYQQIKKFFNERNYSWMRRAIASYIFKDHKQSFLIEAAMHLSELTYANIARIRYDANKRIEDIHDELRKMGYDENGKAL